MIETNATCPLCGLRLEQVRPGLWQCPKHSEDTEAKRAAAAALDALGRTGLVIVRSEADPFGVELGASCTPTQSIALIEMALFKLRLVLAQ